MLLTFEFSYSYKPSEEDFARLLAIVPSIKRRPDDASWSAGCVEGGKHVADIKKVLAITDQIELKQEPITHTLQLVDAIEDIAAKINRFSPAQQLNEKINIHVSDIGLMRVREARVECNVCTDDLNQMLADGWHIIAVCPQPTQRRPDYIFGK